MQTTRVDLGPRSYDIALTTADPAGFAQFVLDAARRSSSALVVTDENVAGHARALEARLSDAGLKTALAVMPPGEESKSLAFAATLYDRLAEVPADRNTLVVAVGGGVVGDLA